MNPETIRTSSAFRFRMKVIFGMFINTVPIGLRSMEVNANGITESELNGIHYFTSHEILIGKRESTAQYFRILLKLIWSKM